MSTAVHPRRKSDRNGHSPGERPWVSAINAFWDRRGVKPVAWTLAVLVWLPFLFVILMVLGINPIFTMAVKKLGSKALKVPVSLQRASVSFSGKLRLGHLIIANPEQFTRYDAVSFDGLYAEVPLRSLLGNVIEIPVLTVVNPVFNLEMGEKNKPSNWAVLMKNLSQSLPKSNEPATPDSEKHFIIRDLKIVHPIVRYRSTLFPDGIDLDLKDVELKKIGNTSDSRSKTYMVFASIFQAILTGGIKDKNLPGDVRGSLKTELGDVSKAFGQAFEGIK